MGAEAKIRNSKLEGILFNLSGFGRGWRKIWHRNALRFFDGGTAVDLRQGAGSFFGGRFDGECLGRRACFIEGGVSPRTPLRGRGPLRTPCGRWRDKLWRKCTGEILQVRNSKNNTPSPDAHRAPNRSNLEFRIRRRTDLSFGMVWNLASVVSRKFVEEFCRPCRGVTRGYCTGGLRPRLLSGRPSGPKAAVDLLKVFR